MLLEVLSQSACRPTCFLRLSKAGLDLDACNRKTITVGSTESVSLGICCWIQYFFLLRNTEEAKHCILLVQTSKIRHKSLKAANPCYVKFPFTSSLKRNKGKDTAHQTWTMLQVILSFIISVG